MRIHCLENVDKSLFFLSNLNVHLENIGAHDIVDGNSRITLGLLWTIILRFQIQDIAIVSTVDGVSLPAGQKRYSKDGLLIWCQMKTADYSNVDIQNFTTSWRNGLAFNALIHKHRPDLINFSTLSSSTPLQNLESAFLIAEKRLGIARLFDPEDIYVEQPDEKSIITYVVTYYHYFSRLKSETVHVRRVGNFLSYLQQMQEHASSYEKDTSNLLAWIFKTITWLDSRDFPPKLEELQQLLADFKQYRLLEKVDKLTEKGNIEMDLFILQAKMLSVNMRMYKPPIGLQVAQVNRAWNALEKAEHLREMALRDELVRQQQLMHLYAKFERKAKLRESWIKENQKLLEQPDHASDLRMTEAAMKKHEALDTDVRAYTGRIDAINQMCEELAASDFHMIASVVSVRDEIMRLWRDFSRRMELRYSMLQNKVRFFRQFSEYGHLKEIIDSLCRKLDTNDTGDHLFAVVNLLEHHELIDTDIRSVHRSMSTLLRTTEDLSRECDPSNHRLRSAITNAKIQEEELRTAYSNLILLSEKRKSVLEILKRHWDLIFELDEQLYFIRERTDEMKSRSKRNGRSIDRLVQVHKMTEMELDIRRITLNEIVERSSRLSEKQYSKSNELMCKLSDVKKMWDGLIQVTSDCKQILMFRKDLQLFVSNCDEAESWMSEKMEQSTFILKQGVQSESLSHIETLLKRQHETMQPVERFEPTIEELRSQSLLLLEMSEEQISTETFPDLMELGICEGIETSLKSDAGIYDFVKQKQEHVDDTYALLIQNVRRTQTALLDALTLHGLFKTASVTYNWIVAKGRYLEHLIPTHMEADYSMQHRGYPAKIEQLAALKYSMSNLELEMSETAEKVSSINRLAANLIEGGQDSESLLNDQVTVDRVISMQNHLNSTWNELADAMEMARDRLQEASAYTDLLDECRYTADWIEDKHALLPKIETVDTSDASQVLHSQSALRNLRSDMGAIEARMEDISVRVTHLADQRQQNESEGKSDDALEMFRGQQPMDILLDRQADLVQRWLTLKQAVEACTDRLATSEEPFMYRLEKFEAWLKQLRMQLICSDCPTYLQETERRLLAQEQHIQELEERRGELSELLTLGRSNVRGQYDPSHRQLYSRLSELEEEWRLVEATVHDRGLLLRKRYSLQYFLTEASLLEVILNQQATFLANVEIPTSLDAVHDTQRQHEAFCESMGTCGDRISATLEMGAKLAHDDPNNRARVMHICSVIEQKCAANVAKAKTISSDLERASRLYEFFYEVEDLEEWVKDKTEDIQLMEKRFPRLPQGRIDALEQEVEANRDRGDKVIVLGKKLVDDYSVLENEVGVRLEGMHGQWDRLVTMIRDLSISVHRNHQEKDMAETIQKTRIWLNERVQEPLTATTAKQTNVMTPDPTALTALQQRFNDREKVKKQIADHHAALEALRLQLDSTSSPEIRHEMQQSISHLEESLNGLESKLSIEQKRLVTLGAASQAYLDLSLEAVWVREKRAQVKLIPDTLRSDGASGGAGAESRITSGQQLLQVQRLRRQLKSHQLETDNRRPRMKILCETIEKTYNKQTPVLDHKDLDQEQFHELLREIRSNWTGLEADLNRLRHELELHELVCQFSLDARESEAWLLEQELYVLATDHPKNEQSAINASRRLLARMVSVRQQKGEIATLKQRSRGLLSQLEQQHTSLTESDSPSKQKRLRSFDNVVRTSLSRVDRAFDSLQELISEKQGLLEGNVSKFKLLRALSDLEEWIAQKATVASSHELGADIDQCFVLRDRFLNFVRLTVPDGTNRLSISNSRCVQLISQSHPSSAEIALAKDSVNEAWADLLELIETRKQLLNAAWDMHHFVGDCQDIEERINFRLNNLPPPPTSALITGKLQGLSSCQRRHTFLQEELTCLEEQMSRLASHTTTLFPRYAGAQVEQLRTRLHRVQATWQRLQALTAGRNAMFRLAARYHDFLMKARDLIMWLETARDQMQMKDRPREVHGVDVLITEHTSLKNELSARSRSIEDCLATGRSLLQVELDVPQGIRKEASTDGRDPMAAPLGEVRERCVQLATGHLLVQEIWRERWDRLHLLLEVRQFARDATGAEAWLVTKELQLEVARRQLGENLSETLTLLGAHYAFQKTLTTANERFNALKRQTTLEMRAMEWKPEETVLREQEKRDKIRQVVQEFMPQYVDPAIKPVKTTVPTKVNPKPAVPVVHPIAPAPPPISNVPVRGHLRPAPTVVRETPTTELIKPRNHSPPQPERQSSSFKPIQPSPRASVTRLEQKPQLKRQVTTAKMVLQPTMPDLTARASLITESARRQSPPEGHLSSHRVLLVPSPSDVPVRESKRVSLTEHSRHQRQHLERVHLMDRDEEPTRSSMQSGSHSLTQPDNQEATETSMSRDSQQSQSSSLSQASPEPRTVESLGNSTHAPSDPPLRRAESLSTRSPLSDGSARTRSGSSVVGVLEAGATHSGSSRLTPEQLMRSIPRLEGPVVRKHVCEIGGAPRSKSAGRGWVPVYMVLDAGQLLTYKDYRSRRQKPEETLRSEAAFPLGSARAMHAIDYTKRPCVFRLHLADKREYLFQTANDRVLQRWMDAINDASKRVVEAEARAQSHESLHPSEIRESRSRSLRYTSSPETPSRRRSIKRFFSLRRGK